MIARKFWGLTQLSKSKVLGSKLTEEPVSTKKEMLFTRSVTANGLLLRPVADSTPPTHDVQLGRFLILAYLANYGHVELPEITPSISDKSACSRTEEKVIKKI